MFSFFFQTPPSVYLLLIYLFIYLSIFFPDPPFCLFMYLFIYLFLSLWHLPLLAKIIPWSLLTWFFPLRQWQRKLILVIPYVPNQFLNNYYVLEIINFHDIILIAEPKIEAVDRKAGEAIKDFKEVVFPDDYNPAGKPAAKRKV